MAFADQARSDLRSILLAGELSELVHYQVVDAAGAQAWKPIYAVVERGDALEPLGLGPAGEVGPQPIRLLILRDSGPDGLPAVNPRRDRVKLQPGTAEEEEYLVVEVLEREDPVAWRLHAVS